MRLVSDSLEIFDVMTVQPLSDCNLVLEKTLWRFAEDHSDAIDRNWTAARLRNSKLFDGDVFVVDRWSIADGVLTGRSLPAKFSAYLYWRDGGVDRGTYSEAFATTVVAARDGGVLLARNVAGTLNEGLFGSPGGLLDEQDVGSDGRLDLAGAASRELSEETGLKAPEMVRQDGFLLAHMPPFLGIASVFECDMSSAQLLASVEGFLAEQPEPELESPVMVRDLEALERFSTTSFARVLTAYALDSE